MHIAFVLGTRRELQVHVHDFQLLTVTEAEMRNHRKPVSYKANILHSSRDATINST